MPRETRLSRSQGLSQQNYREGPGPDEQEKTKRLQEAASKLVQYVLHNLDNKKILRQTVIQKHVATKGVGFPKQMKEANIRLKEVYGCELVQCEDSSVKVASYYIHKTTPHINLVDDNVQANRQKIINLLLIAIVYMSGGKCSVKKLFQLFEKLYPDPDGDLNFVKGALNELMDSKILETDIDMVCWGPLAEVLINKMEILKFVSKMYGTKPASWGQLYHKAQEQKETTQMDVAEGDADDTRENDEDHVSQPTTSQKSQRK